MKTTIAVRTTRYSTLFHRLLETYATGAQIEIDGHTFGESDVPHLLAAWCTNREIRETRNFSLRRDGQLLFNFHDGPENLWAMHSELPFIRSLREEKILRYNILTPDPHRSRSILDRLLDRLARVTLRQHR